VPFVVCTAAAAAVFALTSTLRCTACLHTARTVYCLLLHTTAAKGVENESVEQLAFADRILLNKIDLVTADEKAVVRARVKAINAAAEIIECEQSRVDPSLLLNIQVFSRNSMCI
jgi:G3E family GTPase